MTAFVPVDLAPPGPPPATRAGRVQLTTIPGATYAVALHAGPFDQLDLTYGRLGRHVLDHAAGAEGPIREVYLITPADLRTEVCWPVHH